MSGEAGVICTLGMHRSGTSLVSRMLNLLGVHLGPHQSVSGTREDNPKGFWEHHQLAQLNDEILARFGGRWDQPPAFPASWWSDPRLGDLREKARRLLTDDFATAPLWGWKDPRTCLTLPFWQDLIGSARYVICVRNPSAVAASLIRRDGMSPEKAERLWLTHVQSSLAHTSGQPRMFVFYEDIISEWAPELRRMAAFIGRPERGEDPHVHASVGAFLEPELCHHHLSMEDLAGNQGISFATKGLYLALRGHSPRDTPVDQKTLNLLAAQAIETSAPMAAMSAERDRLAVESSAHAEEASALSRANQANAVTIAALSAERDRLAAEGRAVAEEASALGLESESPLLALREIRASSAWRLVTFWRQVIIGLLPAGTRRRRVFDAVLRRRHGASAHRAGAT